MCLSWVTVLGQPHLYGSPACSTQARRYFVGKSSILAEFRGLVKQFVLGLKESYNRFEIYPRIVKATAVWMSLSPMHGM